MAYKDDFKEVQSNAWWSLPRIVVAAVVVVALMYGLGFLMTGGDLAIYSFWAPKQANAENHVFHNTQAYADGKATYIGRLCRESETATGAQKNAIDGEIVNEASTVNNLVLPLPIQNCISTARGAY